MMLFIIGIEGKKVIIKSGLFYEFVGDSMLDIELEYICVILNLWGLGLGLGVFKIFFWRGFMMNKY